MITLDTPINELYGVGPKLVEKFEVLGIRSIDDLIHFYPRRYEDFTHPRTIDQVVVGSHQIIQASIVSIENDISIKKRVKLTRAQVADQTGQLGLVWFNQPFLIRLLREGTAWLFAGKVECGRDGSLSMVSPSIERDGKILAIYPETVGLSSKMIRKLIGELRHFINYLPDWIPEKIRVEHKLIEQTTALNFIHSPESLEQITLAKRRLAFEELFLLLCKILQTKKDVGASQAPSCQAPTSKLKDFTTSLPFRLTNTQRIACWEIVKDLTLGRPMNRLLEGDVGSGKTVVGAFANLVVSVSGYRTVWMAPTEILAKQHYETCQNLLPKNQRVCLLTSSTSQQLVDQINNFDLIIGTQAVIQEKIRFEKLGLIIVDEQHRFGVKQRGQLLAESKGLIPHFLAMTATPIPRTLALTLYGDLDISKLDSVPTGRQPIISRFVAPTERNEVYQFIRSEIKRGRQAFVVCPLILPSGGNVEAGEQLVLLDEKKAATVEYEKLSKLVFPELRVGLLHGKLKSKEKEATMKRFKEREIDILVTTSVIEVGIDVPNATVMMIEGAERFGLAQLHQFRGRVGRGEYQSYCFVFSDSLSPTILERLKAFTQTTSGFEIAELDLALRGPGQLAGIVQSGISELKIANISDIDGVTIARDAARLVVEAGLANYPLLKGKVSNERRTDHMA